MEAIKQELQQKINRLQKKNAELFLLAETAQSFATAKSTEQIIERLLSFCVQLTGAEKVYYLSINEPSWKLEQGTFKAIDTQEYSDVINRIKSLELSKNKGDCNKEDQIEKTNYTPIPIIGNEQKSILLVNLPLYKNSPEYVDIILKITDTFILALKEKEFSEQLIRSKNALRESEQRWATTLASIGDAVVATDIDGKVTFLNPVAEELTGWTLNEAKGQPINAVLKLINEQTRIDVENPVCKVLQTGVIVGIANHTILLRKDGTEVSINDSAAPIIDAEGKITGVVLVFQDITERKKTADALNKSLEKFKLLSEATAGLLASKNPQAIVQNICLKAMDYLNCDCFFNYLVDQKASKLNLNAYAGIPIDDAMKIKCLDFGVAVCGYAAQRGERIVVEDIQNISNPRAHIIRSYGIQAYACHPLLSQGNVLGTLSFGTKNRTSFTSDELEFMKTITDQVATAMQRIINENALQESRLALEKKAAEVEKYAANMESLAEERARKLRDSERLAAIGATAGMVGHDLRNPLQAVIGEVYLAKSELEEMPESKQKTVLKECVDAIAEQVNYMDKIVSDLQTFVKPVEFYKQEVNLKQLVMSVLAQISIPQSILTNLHIDSTLIMNTDPQLLKRVLINLITNAVQAMPEGGNLDIKAQTNDIEHVEIVVEDTGTGIPDEIKPKIFTPLFTTKSKGQGFGLAACKRVIEAQGGTITFESQEGKGTKFILSLPRD